MIKKILAVCLVFAASFAHADLSDLFNYRQKTTQGPTIKVLLLEDVSGALLEVKGRGYNIYDPRSGSRLGTRFFGKSYYIQPMKNGLKWGEEFPKTYQILVVPDEASTTILINGQEYRGSIYVYQVNSKIHVVNEVSIEDYIKSTLAKRIDEPRVPEAMASLAIAARTQAYYHSFSHKKSFWHVKAQEEGYEGYGVTARHNGVDAAVNATKHLVMVYTKDGKQEPFMATWTENSAGKTASFMTMFRKSIPVPNYSMVTPHAQSDRQENFWSFGMSLDDFSKTFKLEGVSDIKPYYEYGSSRAYGIHLEALSGSKDLDFFTFQKLLGRDKLKSSEFTLVLDQGWIKFSGYGQGHGVGLCLHSAHKMADKGDNAAAILSYFYPESKIVMMGSQKGSKVAKNMKKNRKKRMSTR